MLLYIRNCEYKFVLLSHYLSFFTVSFIFRYFQKCRTHPGCTSISQRTPAQLRLYNIPILSGKVLERRSGKVPCGIRKKKIRSAEQEEAHPLALILIASDKRSIRFRNARYADAKRRAPRRQQRKVYKTPDRKENQKSKIH